MRIQTLVSACSLVLTVACGDSGSTTDDGSETTSPTTSTTSPTGVTLTTSTTDPSTTTTTDPTTTTTTTTTDTSTGTTGDPSGCAGGQPIADGSFEAGTPNPSWTEASSRGATLICDEASCGIGAGTGPQSGDWWVWFGGTDVGDFASVGQDVVLPSDALALRFFLEIPEAAGDGNSLLLVEIDGNIELFVTDLEMANAQTYTMIEVDISAYGDDASHTIEFVGDFAAGTVTSFYVDDAEVVCGEGGTTGTTGG